MSRFDELRRRGVIKVGIAYAIVAWLLIQVVVSVEEPLHLPEWLDTVVIVLLAIGFAVALVVAWAFDMTPEGIQRTAPANRGAAAPAAAADDDRPSIAVLPFADMSPDKDQEYFGDGMTEELLSTLARIRELRVTGRTSSFYYKGRNEDLRKIGEALGVRYILEGSVRKAGEQVRVTAQLIDARSDAHLWSENYDRTLDDLFRIQDDIAESVAKALQITLGVGGLATIPGMTRNPDAYEEYLKANIQRGVDIDMPTEANKFRESVRHLERAVGIDPHFSLAWVGLHFLYGNSWSLFHGGLPQAAEKAKEAMERSLGLTPDSPFVLANLSHSHARHGRWAESDEFLHKAIAAAKRSAVEDHFCFRAGLCHHILGRLDEAIDWYERARMVDPLNATNAAYLSDAYLSMGEPQKAMAEVDRFADFSGVEVVLVKASGAMAAMVTGDRAELVKRLKQLSASEPVSVLTGLMLDRLDDRDAAIAEMHRVLEAPQMQTAFIKNIVAIWAAYWGEIELALKLMREFLLSDQNRFLVFLAWRRIMQDV
ncbi:MAG TPA: tetratricopeptide repeat protein, partial [Steroidobacteraceae bacterium]|nr:tetratricopeptide repeat protein [Steroidobacteraceae bacterium]